MEDLWVYLAPLAVFLVLAGAVKVWVRAGKTGRAKSVSAELIARRLGPIGERQVEQLLQEGHRVRAIAVVRQRTDASLSEAKTFVEATQGNLTDRRG